MPLKQGFPVIISQSSAPKDQMSAAALIWSPAMTSGASYLRGSGCQVSALSLSLDPVNPGCPLSSPRPHVWPHPLLRPRNRITQAHLARDASLSPALRVPTLAQRLKWISDTRSGAELLKRMLYGVRLR